MKIIHWWVAGAWLLAGVVDALEEREISSARVLKLLDTEGKVVVRGDHAYAFDVSKYEFAEKAEGFRLGAYAGVFSGRYVGPYYIKAKLKGAEGDFNLMFEVKTKTTVTDKDGKVLPSQRDAPEGSLMKEVAVGWSLGAMGKVGEVKWVLPENREGKAVDADQVVKAATSVQAEVDGMKLEMSEFGMIIAERRIHSGWRDRGLITIWKNSKGKVRRVRFWQYLDHLREKKLMHDVYFDFDGRPRLAVDVSQSFYREDEGRGDHEHKFWERTLFIDVDGGVVKVMEKEFTYLKRVNARGFDEQVTAHKEIFPQTEAKRRYVACARLMHKADARGFASLANEFRKASETLVKE